MKRRPPQATSPLLPATSLLLDVKDGAVLLGVTERAARSRIARGLLPYRKLNGTIYFVRIELEQFIAELPGVSVEEAKANLALRAGDRR